MPISDIPVQGREFYFEDIQDWTVFLNEPGIDYEITGDTKAELTILPQKQGVFFKGAIKGRAVSPCSRCLEPGYTDIDLSFELFEDFDENRDEQLGSGILKNEGGLWMVNCCQVIIEQLVLAIPDKILCRDECSGLCPGCGKNMNSSPCQCGSASGDPRMAVLQQLKINKK